jgi:dihydrofolate reductase
MGKIIWFMTISLDGYFEGPNHDISWHNVDDEFNKFAIEQLREADTILFGRRTYQLFEDYWPRAANDPSISEENLEIADLINNMKKIVYSRTLQKVEERENWKNMTLSREVNPGEVNALKNQPGKNLSVGGNTLGVSFVQMGLIDEFRILIDPVAIGAGNSLFNGIKNRLKMRLLETRTFKSGNVLLCYEPTYRESD